ncbi:Trhde [Phodopus roborovskii]|uniref:Trhde protein n=1 Tax=Phodopus roborovskii TaxID=109678 RepID=A0AAU9YW88_PHORO|nr:Trhde [Phodopus roborovskii]
MRKHHHADRKSLTRTIIQQIVFKINKNATNNNKTIFSGRQCPVSVCYIHRCTVSVFTIAYCVCAWTFSITLSVKGILLPLRTFGNNTIMNILIQCIGSFGIHYSKDYTEADFHFIMRGAALIRMLANFMGHSVFQRGLQDYLTLHKYGNAARNDLWNTLSEALKRNGKYVNIQEVMDQWTLQMGYPVITILGNMTVENRIIITQQHFIYDISAKTKALQLQNNSYLWQIPLTIVVGNRSHVSSETIIWVSNKSEHHRIAYLDKGSWILGNINQTGYFRVNYDLRNWKLLIDQLIRNHEEYILKQVATTYIKLGWPKNNFNGSLLQASYQHEIPLNVRDIVYCTGVSLLDEDVWEFIWMKFHSTTAVSEKKILLEALTCSDDRNLLNRLLNLSLNSEVVLDQDAIDVIIHVARNPHGRDLAWKFFRDKWKILNTRYGEALFMNSKLISGVTEFLNTEGELKELKNFMKTYDGVASASFSRAVETVEANVRWKRLYQDELFQWLGKAVRH